MCFSIIKQGSLENVKIKIRNEEIEEVNDFKFLGIILDLQLTFDKHVKKDFKNSEAQLKLKLIRHYIPTQTAQLFMHYDFLSFFILYDSMGSSTIIYNQTLHIFIQSGTENNGQKAYPVAPLSHTTTNRYSLLSFESFTHFSFFQIN